MFAQFKKLLLTVAALCVFSVSSIAAESTTVTPKAVKAKVEQAAPKVEEGNKTPKVCDFRISTA